MSEVKLSDIDISNINIEMTKQNYECKPRVLPFKWTPSKWGVCIGFHLGTDYEYPLFVRFKPFIVVRYYHEKRIRQRIAIILGYIKYIFTLSFLKELNVASQVIY
jgi:hypothetical protein